jgi:hypothetical protein
LVRQRIWQMMHPHLRINSTAAFFYNSRRFRADSGILSSKEKLVVLAGNSAVR